MQNDARNRKKRILPIHFGRGFETLEGRRMLAADVVINEIMYHQAGDNTAAEFIELFNSSDSSIDLQGWQFDDGIDFTFPAVSIPSGGYVVVAADAGEFSERYPSVTNFVGGWVGRLANRGEWISLIDSQGVKIDQLFYSDQGDWATTRLLAEPDNGFRGWSWQASHDGDGKSLELQNPALTNDYGHNWAASIPDGGTPGAPNSILTDDVAPLIADVAHVPLIPSSSDSVSVTASVFDESPADVTATVSYRLDGTPIYTEVPMTRVGSTFSAVLPAFPTGAIVEFFVTSTDGAGNARSVPNYQTDDTTRSANRLYQVLDDALSVDSWRPDEQPVTHLIMTNMERELLRDIGDGPFVEAESNAQMNGTFIRTDGNGEDVRYEVGIRNRGGASRIGPPNNYRINLPHDATFQGRTRLNLNSRFAHAQVLGSAIYRLAGMAAAEGRPMQVRINGADVAEPGGPVMYGSYVEMEVITGGFPDRYFPGDRHGNLYRVIESGTETGDLRFEGPLPAAYQDTYSKRTNEEDNDWTDLIDLVEALNNSTDEDFVTEVHRVLDVDQWLRYIALDSLLGNLETGLNIGRGDNYWLYRGISDNRFRIIPHDLDTIFGVGSDYLPNRSIYVYQSVAGLRRLLSHPEFLPRYHQAFVDLIDTVYNPDTLFPLMDRLVGYVSDNRLATMKQFVIDRTVGVLAQLPTEFSVTTATNLPVVNGYPRTAQPTVDLVGTANGLKTKSVLVNGIPAEWSFNREWAILGTEAGTTQTLVDTGSTWRYQDDGTNQGTAWRTITLNDEDWQSGPSPLGYGNGDEATTLGFGADPNDKVVTTYFRHDFEISDASSVLDLSLQLQRDDGAIVYLNNEEIVRTNMPVGEINFQTVASRWIGGANEVERLSFSIPSSLIVDGKNVLAVEVHQVSPLDDDLRFDLSLDATFGEAEGGVPLSPGINRLTIEAFDGPAGTGELVDSQFVDIWYDGAKGIDEGLCSDLSQFGTLAPTILNMGVLTEDTVLAPCGSAYRVTGAVTIPADVTLTILPGTSLFFETNAGLTFDGGQLVAEGEKYAPIRFTKAPEVVSSWDGIQFIGSVKDNRISHAILEHATTEDGLVGLLSSRLTIENSTFDHADFFRIVTADSSLVVRNSTFADIFAPGEPPVTDNNSEHINGSGIMDGGQLLLEGNFFGTTTGHNDSVDFDGAQLPGPIPIIRDNVFAGSGDDALDLEADAYIEGNTFFNVMKDQFNTASGDANAISAGGGKTYYAYRNKFHNIDHAVQVKDDAFLYFEHNTVDTVHISPIYFDLPDRTPGIGAAVDASIFTNAPTTFGAADQAQQLTVTNSIVTDDALGFGEGNFQAEPRLANPAEGDFSLLLGSPAISAGFSGMDLGAEVSPSAWIGGEPGASTGRTSATLAVGGPGLTHYRYRLNGGPWSHELEAGQSIELRDLPNGTYEVEVIGKNAAGIWQNETSATKSKAWTVDTSRTHLYLNEILASNSSVLQAGETTDLIELYNDSDLSIDLSGMRITDDFAVPSKFVFPDGAAIEAGEYKVLLATDDLIDGALGFRLARDGEGVFLFAADGTVIDSLEYGIQVTDLSISRIGNEREWKLSSPTFGAANSEIALGSASSLRINEWMGAHDVHFKSDFLEFYNSDSVPVSLSGLYVTDDPIGRPTRHQIAPLSFIGGHGFEVFDPNGNPENGANELEFGLSAEGEMIALLDADLRPIDQVLFLSQTIDTSEGRSPDGSLNIVTPALATPGRTNPVANTEVVSLLDFDATWSFDQSGNDLGTNWRETDFDDDEWSVAAGPFGVANADTEIPLTTPLEIGPVTYYFRSEFSIDEQLFASGNTVYELSTLLDDGAVIYINNVEVLRLGLPDGEVNFQTTASRGIGLASVEGPFIVPADVLKPGKNAIAVELHQLSRASNDAVFGVDVTATTTILGDTFERAIAIANGLRVSELMYHPSGEKDAEYIEIVNVSDVALDLLGVRLSGGIRATLPAMLLAPGERIVLSPDADVFRATYGTNIAIAGIYDGNLSNGGEELIIGLPAPFDGPFDGVVLRFTYSDDWFPETDGDGYSLQIVDENAHANRWDRADGWRVSSQVGGTPGEPDMPTRKGDINGDDLIDVRDVDLLSAAIIAHSTDSIFDLNDDNAIDLADQTFLVEEILGSHAGDVDLDGHVDFADFLVLSANFGKQTESWSDGDFDANGVVDFADFLALAAGFSS